MNQELEAILDTAKRHLRANTILLQPFRPHAIIPVDINTEKVKEALKKLEINDDELTALLDEMPDNVRHFGIMGLDFEHQDESLFRLGSFLSLLETPKAYIISDTSVDDGDALCVSYMDMVEPDVTLVTPYKKVEDDNLKFEDMFSATEAGRVLKENLAKGFISAESGKYLVSHPDCNTDAYVDELMVKFPNAEGKLNANE